MKTFCTCVMRPINSFLIIFSFLMCLLVVYLIKITKLFSFHYSIENIRYHQMERYIVKNTVPLGVSRLWTFCRIKVSTKAAGGQLIPTVLSLLSTSNMMASNKRPPTEGKKIDSHFLGNIFTGVGLLLTALSLTPPSLTFFLQGTDAFEAVPKSDSQTVIWSKPEAFLCHLHHNRIQFHNLDSNTGHKVP